LVDCDLYAEAPKATPRWAHLQTRAIASGKRVFNPWSTADRPGARSAGAGNPPAARNEAGSVRACRGALSQHCRAGEMRWPLASALSRVFEPPGKRWTQGVKADLPLAAGDAAIKRFPQGRFACAEPARSRADKEPGMVERPSLSSW